MSDLQEKFYVLKVMCCMLWADCVPRFFSSTRRTRNTCLVIGLMHCTLLWEPPLKQLLCRLNPPARGKMAYLLIKASDMEIAPSKRVVATVTMLGTTSLRLQVQACCLSPYHASLVHQGYCIVVLLVICICSCSSGPDIELATFL